MDNTEYRLAQARWNDLELLQEHYAEFNVFLREVMQGLLGFHCSDIQEDIGEYLASGPLYKMVQAQRGQAKTTITAILAVWRLIHNPRCRILIVSAGSSMATEIANWVIKIIMGMPELECLRPDTSHGDRSSVEAFDIHWHLKGAEKSPSVACIGITSNMQGKRADVLIADDIESSKNSQTATQRDRLKHLTLDFTSICSRGEIIYLGTPQNVDSVYNSLPSRGFDVRIWPGRYPTEQEQKHYGTALAPLIIQRMQDDPSLRTGGGALGTRGKAVDPVLIPEDVLTAKEIDSGAAYFQLQYMLDTRLLDADRFPLKSDKLLFMSIPSNRVPAVLNWAQSEYNRVYPPQGFPLKEDYYKVIGTGDTFGEFQGTHMYIDPAGGGATGDELAWAVTKFFSGYVYLVDVGGMPGGYGDLQLDKICKLAERWKPSRIDIEENFGHGAFKQILLPKLLAVHPCHVEDVWESGQKELRILDTLEPMISSQRLVVEENLLRSDWESIKQYSGEQKASYSFFFQLARITRDRKALVHDDRLDAVAGSCRFWVQALAQDKAKIAARIQQDNYNRMIQDPIGNGRPVKFLRTEQPSLSQKLLRGFK